MLISVVAFRKPASILPPELIHPPETVEHTETSTVPSVIVTNYEEQSREEEPPAHHLQPRRSRGATLVQVLPLLISSVPVRTSIQIPTAEPRTVRRHSLCVRTHSPTIMSDIPITNADRSKVFERSRSNTIAVPLQTLRKNDGHFERIRQPLKPLSLAPILAVDEVSEEDEKSSSHLSQSPPTSLPLLSSSQTVPKSTSLEKEVEDEHLKEPHWLVNSRFILFCLSNFALCLVMGVPYVIFPTYISETFLDQGYLASWTLSNVGIASALGQILLGYLHDRKVCSAWLMYTCAVTISGASLIVLALFRYKLVVLICAFMFGLAISANYALQVLIVIDALTIENMSNAFGILQFCQGVSTLIGIPIQGIYRKMIHIYLSFKENIFCTF